MHLIPDDLKPGAHFLQRAAPPPIQPTQALSHPGEIIKQYKQN